jgi:hypothetical protein
MRLKGQTLIFNGENEAFRGWHFRQISAVIFWRQLAAKRHAEQHIDVDF